MALRAGCVLDFVLTIPKNTSDPLFFHKDDIQDFNTDPTNQPLSLCISCSCFWDGVVGLVEFKGVVLAFRWYCRASA